jgi:hypothetical protein
MSMPKEIQQVIDQLIYNKTYAPNYPAEDKTNLDLEKSRILLWLDYAIASIRREDVGDWLRLGRSSIEEAFGKLQNGDRKDSVRDFQFSVQYLRNALARKPHKVDFISKPGGSIIIAPPSNAEEQQEE